MTISVAHAKKRPSLEVFPYNRQITNKAAPVMNHNGFPNRPLQQNWIANPQPTLNMNAQPQQMAPTPYNQYSEKVVFKAPDLKLSYEDFITHADKNVNYLIKNDNNSFLSNISPNMMQYFGPDKLEQNIASTLVPFFNDFKQFDKNMTVAPTRDAWGNEGYSFYQSFITKSGDRKKFVLQMVIEDGQIVIANLTPDIESPYQ